MDEDDGLFSISTTVAGVSFRQDAVARCSEGQIVDLIRNPSNEHDTNAIEVHAGEQIGFISKDVSKILALYMDLAPQVPLTATIVKLTGGTREKPTRGVVIDIGVDETVYLNIEADPESWKHTINSVNRVARIEASLTDEQVREYIRNMDDVRLDAIYWHEHQNKWEKEQIEKVEKRFGRELESYEIGELVEKAAAKFEQYRERHEISPFDRERIRKSLTKRDVAAYMKTDSDVEEITNRIKEKTEQTEQEDKTLLTVGLIIAALIVLLIIALIARP